MSKTPFSWTEKRDILKTQKEERDKRLKEIMGEKMKPIKKKKKKKNTGY